MLSQLLYNHPDLRLPVLKGLKLLVESNLAVASEDNSSTDLEAGHLTIRGSATPEEAAQNVTFLKSQVESWFAVFFNIFGSVDRDCRGVAGDVIGVWANLAESQDVSKACLTVVGLFKQHLQKVTNAPNDQQNATVAATMQDLLILLLPFLETPDITSLFRLCLSEEVLSCKDNGIQKRGYKLLAKSISSGKLQVDVLDTLRTLDSFVTGLSPAAKKDRFVLLSSLVPGIPLTSMHIIPSLIPEAVLGTKEPSEKARMAAFDLVVTMGRKMCEGGTVKRQMLDEMDSNDTGEGSWSLFRNVGS